MNYNVRITVSHVRGSQVSGFLLKEASADRAEVEGTRDALQTSIGKGRLDYVVIFNDAPTNYIDGYKMLSVETLLVKAIISESVITFQLVEVPA